MGPSCAIIANSTDPLRVCTCHRETIDLVVTNMPVMTGNVLSRERLKPDPSLILSTGFNKTLDETRTRPSGILKFIMKSAGSRDLAKALRQSARWQTSW